MRELSIISDVLTAMSSNRPHVFIPGPRQDAQQPAVPGGWPSQVPSKYTFQVSPPYPFTGQDIASASLPPVPSRPYQTPMTYPQRPRIQSVSDHYPTATSISFPEPYFHRSTSYRENLPVPHKLPHRHSGTDINYNPNLSNLRQPHVNPSMTSFASSYAEDDHYGLGSSEVRVLNIIAIISSNLYTGARR